MLQLLHIENIAVIERADISFRAGFNALTGETGAGKSIVIDSLGAVLGARTSRDLIRTGAAKAFVSAEFDGVDASLPVLAALGVEPEDGVLLLQRDIYADGKNICRANGRPITVAQLRALGTSLLNIHGQHEGTQLLDEEQHGAYLDRFARLDGLPEAYTARYQAVRETQRQIEALEMDEAEKARRVDTLRHQIAELERAELRDGEEEELLARREVDMNKVRFSIDFTEHEPDATGIDTVRFLMSANAGEDLKPIHKIASGGELARIMLALKNVLAEQDHVMTMVFDEVDTGVSGRAAQRVAEKMAKLSRRRQVLCVTHLPQLAAMADTHFSVEKGEENGRTFTRVVELDRAQRCAELARLTGGAAATETQLRGAEELLSAADAFRSAL